jgi:hypothetical protein
MNDGFILLANNVGMGVSDIITLVVCLGLLIFFALDFRLGVLLMFMANLTLFIWFFNVPESWGWGWPLPLTISLISLVLLSFSLYFNNQVAARGGLI